MPYVTNQGVQIHYVVEGQGPPLMLMHGLTHSHKMWKEFGYVQELKDNYQLILVDSRGCGDSGKPHDINAYDPKLITGDIVAVLNDLGVEKANYWGYSYGCRIGFQLMRYHPTHFSSYILGAGYIYPLQSEAQQLIASIINRLRLGAEQGPEAVIAFREKTLGRPESAYGKQRIRGNDYTALLALRENIAHWPSSADLLSQVAVPCLLYAGDRDPFYAGMKEATQHIPNARFVTLPNMNHGEAFFQSSARDLILPHVQQFLQHVSYQN